MIEIKEPDFDSKWFKHRANEALKVFEARRTIDNKQQYLDVLAGLFRHAYQKGRHDEKADHGK